MVQFFAIFCTWFTCVLLAVWTTSLAYDLMRGRLADLAPDTRNIQQSLIALMPIAMSLVVTLLVFQPTLAFILLPQHCHSTVCVPHQPFIAISSAGGIALAGGSLLGVCVCLALLLSGVLRGRRQQRLLNRLSRAEGGYRVVESPRLQAWCFGLWRPKVYASSETLRVLPEDELRVVLAHEYCHVLRRDNLRRLFMAAATLVWLPASRRRFLDDYSLSTEQVCDQSAASVVGDAELVSATLTRIESVTNPRIAARLRSLQGGQWQHFVYGAWGLTLVLWGAQFLMLLLSAHVLLERLLPI